MTERTFLVQRYASGNWPQVRGEVPFLATGPNFFKYTTKMTLEKFGEYRFIESLPRELEEAFGGHGQSLSRYFTAWALLETGIVQALWCDHSRVPEDRKWGLSVDQLADEIPKDGPLGQAVLDYLCGLSGPEHFRSYVSEDGLELVACPVPAP